MPRRPPNLLAQSSQLSKQKFCPRVSDSKPLWVSDRCARFHAVPSCSTSGPTTKGPGNKWNKSDRTEEEGGNGLYLASLPVVCLVHTRTMVKYMQSTSEAGAKNKRGQRKEKSFARPAANNKQRMPTLSASWN